MKLITLICLAVVCVGMNVLYSVFNQERSWKGLLVRGLTILSCLALAIVSANLNLVNNAFSMFICLGLATMLLTEAVTLSDIVDEKPKLVVFGFLSFASNAFFACSVFALTGFNLFAIVGGLLLGLAVGSIVCAIKRYKRGYQVFATLMSFASIGLFLIHGVIAIIYSTHLIPAIMLTASANLMLISKTTSSLISEESKINYFSTALYVLSAIVVAGSIYFY